jgi:hypothetical protein
MVKPRTGLPAGLTVCSAMVRSYSTTGPVIGFFWQSSQAKADEERSVRKANVKERGFMIVSRCGVR